MRGCRCDPPSEGCGLGPGQAGASVVLCADLDRGLLHPRTAAGRATKVV